MPIYSLLDTDLYKFSMQLAVLQNFAGAEAVYRFKDRNKTVYNDAFIKGLEEDIDVLSQISLRDVELRYIRDHLAFLAKPDYLSYLNNYRFDPNQIKFGLDSEGCLELEIFGNWEEAILWEIPLMACISERYFLHCDTNWTVSNQYELAENKALRLSYNNCTYADFSTRRRRNLTSQETFVKAALSVAKKHPGFVGTSNVHLARIFDTKAIGTMAHEWFMGISGLVGLRHANREGLWRWANTYEGNLGIALPDTFGTQAFFEDFDGQLARMYDGVRHDSGDPLLFGDKVIDHYRKHNIKCLSKTIVFSDSLNVQKALEIQKYFAGRINVSYGIGTHFSNDFQNSPPLNIVIKLWSINGIPVVKLSDEPGKIQGDRDACRVANWTFFGTPLDLKVT